VTLITFETLISGFERDYESYVNFMAELKRPIQLGINVVTIWAGSAAFIMSTSGIFLAFAGIILKKNKG
jgi:ABC-type transport system involved in cytochrome bd biosynthesis fused ATPase/permease subunit